jgi:diacylglycerol kinase family enzyme
MNPAFAYIYDDFLADKRFERELIALETELAHRGIEGRVARLAMFRQARDLVQDMVRAGVKNIVVVGNDQTLQKLMWFLPDLEVTLGYVPMNKPMDVAARLGIPLGAPAADILAARLVETVDVGKIHDRYFFSEVTIPATVAALEIEGRYRVRPIEGGAIAIRNLALEGTVGIIDEAKDGQLEAVIQSHAGSSGKSRLWSRHELTETVIPLKHGKIISHEPIDVFVDGHALNGFSFDLSIIPKKLRLITGGRRLPTIMATRPPGSTLVRK